MSTLPQLALTYTLVMNPLGNAPLILTLLQNYDFKAQQRIIFREGLFGFAIAIIFQFFGDHFLRLLNIEQTALSLCGGIIIFLLALKIIFPTPKESAQKLNREPYIVPIATPILVGPGTLSLIMVTAANEPNSFVISTAIILACSCMIAITTMAPYLQKLIGKSGMAALGQMTGILLVLMAVEMIYQGILTFITRL